MMSGPYSDLADNISFAVDRPSLANLAVSMTAKGMCPNTRNKTI